MSKPSALGISRAAKGLRGRVHRTPVLTSSFLDSVSGARLFFKCENLQRTGSFKVRGATNALQRLSEEQRARGVVTHSSGNHAAALAYAASALGVRATVVMPENAPAVKVAATRGYGAEVLRCESTAAAREAACARVMRERGLTFVPPYDHPDIVEGAGTACRELVEEVPGLDAVVAPVGGGGLLSGTALAARDALGPGALVLAAEPRNADDAARSMEAGAVQPVSDRTTIADGLRTPLSELTFGVIRRHVDRVSLVDEDAIVAAMRLLWERMKLVVEPSGAVPLAAVLGPEADALRGKRVGIIISGGNLELDALFDAVGADARRNSAAATAAAL